MKTFEEMENEDGYMMLKFKNRFESRKKSKGRNIIHLYLDSSLKLHYSLRSKIIPNILKLTIFWDFKR